jgi:hypothetical protein
MKICSDYKVEKIRVWDDGEDVLSEVKLRKVQNENCSAFAPESVTIKSNDNGTWASMQLRDVTIEIRFADE